MRLLILLLLILLCPAITAAQTKCFGSEWLQGERSVNLAVTGNKVTGTFVVSLGDDTPQSYSFSGTRRGNVLTVAFADGKLPDITPSEIKSLVWTLVKTGNRQLLRIKVFGKNYQTNKYENSFAYFRRKECEQDKGLKKRKTIAGIVVAYHPIPCRRHLCSVWIIVRAGDSKAGQPRYVQLNVEYYNSPSSPNEGFPKALIESAKEWRFEVERDVGSDIAIPKYVRFVDIETGEDTSAKAAIPAWMLVPGAEGEKLPYGEVLPAYSVEYNGYKPKRHSPRLETSSSLKLNGGGLAVLFER